LARRAAPDSSLIRAAVPAAVSKPTIQIATPPQTAQAPSNLKPAQPTAQITTPPVTQAPAVSTYNPASQTPQPPQRTNFGTPLHIATPVAQPTPVQTPRPATPPAMPAQSRPITPASSSSTPVTPVRPTPTPIVPAATVTPVTQPPAVVEKAPVPSLKNTEPDDLLVIPKTTTPVAPAAAPVQPVTQPPAPALSPDELLAQDHERPKMSMADRLKLKGIEFSNNSQNGEG
jgi:hypothetical protein